MLALIGRPVKHFGRITSEGRMGLCAASAALRAASWRESGDPEIGLITSSRDGCLRDNHDYFRDYVASGRTLGRGNLFMYTLPTSVVGEIAIALSLTGPSVFHYDDVRPLAALIRAAERLLTDNEAERMLAMWSDPQAALCMAFEPGEKRHSIFAIFDEGPSTPLELARQLQVRARRA
jgi:hypothetical protein